MTDEESSEKIAHILKSDSDDGQAAKSHLAAGRPIYYCDDAHQNGVIRKWPDGRRELLTVGEAGTFILVKVLPTQEAT